MKNVIVFLVLCGVLVLAIFLGMQRGGFAAPQPAAIKEQNAGIPSVGRIQILNGCGVAGAADKVKDFLQAKGFDVKNKDNARTNNYPFTIVVSRKKDCSTARLVANSLETDKIALIRRTADDEYDVTVFVGADFLERIK
jgi:hypothetical protein